MTGDQRIGVALVSVVAPGFAHAISARSRRIAGALGWAGAGVASCAFGVLGLPVLIAIALIRLAAAADALRVTRRIDGAPSWGGFLPTATALAGIAGLVFLKWSLQLFSVPTSSMNPTIPARSHVLADALTIRWRPPARGEVVLFEYPCAPDKTYVKRVIALAGDTVEVRCNVVYVNDTPIEKTLIKELDSYRDYDDFTQGSVTRSASRYREVYAGYRYDVFQEPGSAGHHDFPVRDRPFVPSCQQGNFYDRGKAAPTGTIIKVERSAPAKPCEPQLHYRVPAGTLFVLGDNRDNANDSRVWGAVSLEAVLGRMIEAY